MRELHAILDAWSRGAAGGDAALATVVEVSGSAYRRPGARMLVAPDCRIGTISGGCLEAEVSTRARWLAAASGPVVRAYDTRGDGDAGWEFGLGCQGVVHILFERVASPSCAECLTFLQSCREAGLGASVVTLIRTQRAGASRVGDRLWLDERGTRGGALTQSALAPAALEAAAAALASERSALLHLPEADLFVEWVPPAVSLTIFGAGDDAQPLAAVAVSMGWDVTVADGRADRVTAGRFPGARVVLVSTRAGLPGVPLDRRSAVVMMTHSYPFDRALLAGVVASQPRYLGILGPRARTEQLFADCGLSIESNVHAPVGLDVGGDTPAAIALGIAAEIQAVLSGRTGGRLRDRLEAIHDALPEFGRSRIVDASAVTTPACGLHLDGVA